MVVEALKIPNICKIAEAVMVSFKPIESEEEVLSKNFQSTKKLNRSGKKKGENEQTVNSPFEIQKIKNN